MKKIVSVLLGVAGLFLPAIVMAQEHATAMVEGNSTWALKAALAIGAGIGIGIASFGGALGQGRAAAAALEGVARNPEASGKVTLLMIIALALIESLVIYSLVIAYMLQGKI